MSWRHTASAHARGYGANWQKVRELARRRAQGLCEACKARGRIVQGRECDHIVPKARGGTDALDNLQWLCTPCHQAKTIKDSGGTVHGCDVTGWPIDPMHHWGAGTNSVQG